MRSIFVQTMKLYSFLFALAVVSGCRHTLCENSPVTPAFIGFNPADVDTIIVRAFQPNDNYQHLLDTLAIIKDSNCYFTTSNDTTIIYFADFNNQSEIISTGSDWQIYIPTTNRTITISDIMSQQTEEPVKYCLNPISSFIQDGQLVVPKLVNSGVYYTSGYLIYITNN
jgi:hypothetical protein